MECNKQNIELCFNDVKLMEFWNGVNVINNLSFRLIVYPINAIPFWQNFHIYETKHSLPFSILLASHPSLHSSKQICIRPNNGIDENTRLILR